MGVPNLQECAVVFIVSSQNKNSLAALAGYLSFDLSLKSVSVFFVLDRPDIEKRIGAIADTFRYLVLAFSFMTPALIHINTRMKAIRAIVSKNAQCRTLFVAGGPHPSGDYESCLRMGFDAVIVGEGEISFRELLRNFFRREDWRGIPGLARIEKGEIQFNRVASPKPPLDDFPPFSPEHRFFTPIEITRGCTNHCRFCQTPGLTGTEMRHRSLQQTIHWISQYRRRPNEFVRFVTPNAFAFGTDGRHPDPQPIKEFLQEIRNEFPKRKIFFGSFPAEVRPDWVTFDMLSAIKPFVSNDSIVMGGQTGSDRLLERYHRDHDSETILKAATCMKKFDFTPIVDFIFGLPEETEEDAFMTIRLIDELIRIGALIHSHAFIPLPGTPFYGMPNVSINPLFLRMIHYLEGRGFEFGEWRAQSQISGRVSLFLQQLKENPISESTSF